MVEEMYPAKTQKEPRFSSFQNIFQNNIYDNKIKKLF